MDDRGSHRFSRHARVQEKKSLRLFLAAILTACLALAMMAVFLSLYANFALDQQSNTLGFGASLLAVAAVGLGVADVALSFNNAERRPSAKFRVFILVVTAFLLSQAFFLMVAAAKTKRARMFIAEGQLRVLQDELEEYANSHDGLLPDANEWCDALLRNSTGLTRNSFTNPAESGSDCNFAFNTYVSGYPLSKIPDDVVLLFQANGPWNLNGGAELLRMEHSARNAGGVSVLFKDGGFGTYSLTRDAVRLEDTEEVVWRKVRWQPERAEGGESRG